MVASKWMSEQMRSFYTSFSFARDNRVWHFCSVSAKFKCSLRIHSLLLLSSSSFAPLFHSLPTALASNRANGRSYTSFSMDQIISELSTREWMRKIFIWSQSDQMRSNKNRYTSKGVTHTEGQRERERERRIKVKFSTENPNPNGRILFMDMASWNSSHDRFIYVKSTNCIHHRPCCV